MGTTLIQILPLAIGATFSPSGLLFVMLILSGKDNPKKSSLTFITGAALFLLALGLFIMLAYRHTVQKTGGPGAASAVIDMGMGVLIILLVGISLLRRKSGEEKPAKTKHHRPYLLLGILFMLTNASTLVLFVAASKMIAEDGLPVWDNGILFLILLLISMFMVSFPVLITVLMPKQAGRILGPVTRFMSRHGGEIAKAYFALMGVYLIIHGALRV